MSRWNETTIGSPRRASALAFVQRAIDPHTPWYASFECNPKSEDAMRE